MPRGVAIYVDGRVEEIEADLPTMQAVVEGYIEIAPTPGAPFVMFVNEEGKIHGLQFNEAANTLANHYRDWEDPLVGNAVLVGLPDGEGEHLPFTAQDLAAVIFTAFQGPLPYGQGRTSTEREEEDVPND